MIRFFRLLRCECDDPRGRLTLPCFLAPPTFDDVFECELPLAIVRDDGALEIRSLNRLVSMVLIVLTRSGLPCDEWEFRLGVNLFVDAVRDDKEKSRGPSDISLPANS